ncbi:hypothetical protein VL04_17425 [Chromobacterium violaceum]|uniref:hypothetical protein n=1 Tax=Chromobacterium violaceum TaxID=536 RepID=UPI000652FE68|nr:hypothetical protein [Chromobacterium violaceum]KMN48752.1 hypothetical protein VK93_14690 [Chromobacterium violaceum]KMN87847.1 hypothetical protein VL02_00685 [Chromobacterium violaceum]KMN89076.1 hypothetical protein VL04_17425 [Chromobacterium violaceum]KMO05450.1 hypothetical protein VL16_02670 [Chromobacterium violaceum]
MAAEDIKDLVVIEKASVQEVFLHRPTLEGILEQIRGKALSIAPDLSTATSRKNIASVAYNVAKAKTYLDDLAKARVAELKDLPKQIDESRKYMRDFLDKLKDEVRQPLTDWEAEQERIAAEQKAAEEAAALARQIEADHEIGLLMNREFDRVAQEKRQADIKAQQERDAEIARQAEEKARREADERAEAERQAAIQRELDARMAVERAERERQAAEQRAKDAEAKAERDRVEAEERAKQAAAQAEADRVRAAEEAAAAERRRLEREAEAKAEEENRRAADRVHRGRINSEVLADLKTAGLTEDQAKAAIRAIVNQQVRHVAIQY